MKTPILFALALMVSAGLLAQEPASENETAGKTLTVPSTIAFQGRLHDSGGQPVDGDFQITFALYDDSDPAIGNLLWTEVQWVNVTDGLFQVNLGAGNPLLPGHFDGTNRWLGIRVDEEEEMSPRTRLTSVPFALQAGGQINLPGTFGQTLLHNGTTWEPSNFLINTGSAIGINSFPATNHKIFIYRHTGDVGPDHSNLYAIRYGDVGEGAGGNAWNLNGVDAAIKAYSYFGNEYSAAIAGFSDLDYPSSAGIIGGSSYGSSWGALGFIDASGGSWAGYFNGNLYTQGKVGIGTPNPTQSLSVVGNLSLRGFIIDSVSSSGTPGQVLSRGTGGIIWTNPPGDNWGTQSIVSNLPLAGNGTGASPLQIAQLGASTGQVLKWNGSEWGPANDLSGITLPFLENCSTNVGFTIINNAGIAMEGLATSSTNVGTGMGLMGESRMTSGTGVRALASSINGTTYGLRAESKSDNGFGVYAKASHTSGENFGVLGESTSVQGIGVFGVNYSTDGFTAGIRGHVSSPIGFSGIFTGGRFYVGSRTGIGIISPEAGLHLYGTGFPETFMFLQANAGQDAGFRIYEGTTAKWHIFNNAGLGGLQIYNNAGATAIFAKQSNSYVGIGTTSPTAVLHAANPNVLGGVALVKGEYTGTTAADVIGVEGRANLSANPGWGIGGLFEGGFKGISVNAITGTSGFAIFGTSTAVTAGGSGSKYGLFSSTEGTAANTGILIGVFGTTAGTATTRYAGYFSGDVTVTGTFSNPSDRTLKRNLTTLTNPMEKLMDLPVYEYEYIPIERMNLPEGRQFGFVAQDLEKLFPELVTLEKHPLDDPNGKTESTFLEYRAINYLGMIPVLTRAIQEQQSLIQTQQQTIEAQQKALDELLRRIEALESK